MTQTHRQLRFVVRLVWMLLILTISVMQLKPVSAQSLQTTTLSGWLSILYGDPPPNSNLPPRIVKRLVDYDGTPLAYLIMDDNSAQRFNKQLIQVSVQVDDIGAANAGDIPTYAVIAIEALIGGQQLEEGGVSAQLAGAQPYINLLCSFPGINMPPHALSWYQGLLGNSYPALGNYWSETSYGSINLNGSSTTAQWYVMPHQQSYYLSATGDADLDLLLQDCIQIANAAVNFSNFVGINMFFDGNLDCCAWGGWSDMTLDGSFKRYQLTWLPAWVGLATVGHEMGHGFGLPHSSGPAANPPTGLDIYVSSWDIMSSSSSNQYSVYDSVYRYLPPGTIAYHRDMLNWIPANRKISFLPGEAGTITLEQLQQPQANSHYLLAKIPIGGSSTRFYTVEVRTHSGYDQSVPPKSPAIAGAVIIHQVDMNRIGNAGHALVVDGDTNLDVNDAGAMWLPGEIFNDPVNKIQIRVDSSTSTSFTVYLSNNVSPTAAPSRNFYDSGSSSEMSWSAVSWALGYTVQIDDDTSFDNPVVDQDVPTSQLSLPLSVSDGIYYWRVCAWRTTLPSCGGWSAAEKFTVKTN